MGSRLFPVPENPGIPLLSGGISAIVYLYHLAHAQEQRIRAGRPTHEMRTSHIFDGKGLDSHAE